MANPTDLIFAHNVGNAIIRNGVPYRYVGAEREPTNDSWIIPDPGSDDFKIYNISPVDHGNADIHGKRYYSAEEMAIAILPEYSTVGEVGLALADDEVGTLIAAVPTDGILRIYANSDSYTSVFANGVKIYNGDSPASQIIRNASFDLLGSGGDFSTSNSIQDSQPFSVEAGDVITIQPVGGARTFWYYLLPHNYPPPA